MLRAATDAGGCAYTLHAHTALSMTHCFLGFDMHSQVIVDHLAMMEQDHTLYCTGVEARVANWTDDVWAMNMEDVQGRSGKACRIHWHNHCKPSLNHETWSEQEEAHLRGLAAQHGQRKVGHGAWSH